MGRVFTAYRKKHLLTAIAALSDVMRDAWDHDPCKTSHGLTLRADRKDVNYVSKGCQLCIVSPEFP